MAAQFVGGGDLVGGDFEEAGAAFDGDEFADTGFGVGKRETANDLVAGEDFKGAGAELGEIGHVEIGDEVAEAVDMEDGPGPTVFRRRGGLERGAADGVVD